MPVMELILKVKSSNEAPSDEITIHVPYSLLLTGFKIAFLVPNAVDEKIRSLLRPIIEKNPLPFKTDCIEEWLISLRGRVLEASDEKCSLSVSWI